MNDKDWTKVGSLFVDAGIMMIGDPCYSLPIDGHAREDIIPGEDWGAFCDKLDHGDETTSFGHIAIVTPTGYGDGEYDVFVKRNIEGRVAEIKVVFIDEDEDDETLT